MPELKPLPARYRFEPWKTPQAVQDRVGFTIGRDYPEPIVDLGRSRKDALAAFEHIRR